MGLRLPTHCGCREKKATIKEEKSVCVWGGGGFAHLKCAGHLPNEPPLFYVDPHEYDPFVYTTTTLGF